MQIKGCRNYKSIIIFCMVGVGIMLLSGCSQPQVREDYKKTYCDGSFIVSYEVTNKNAVGLVFEMSTANTVNINRRLTVDPTVKSLGKGESVLVTVKGSLRDPCENGALEFQARSRQTAETMVVSTEIAAIGVKATSIPARVRIDEDGNFRYEIVLECCGDSEGNYQLQDRGSSGVSNLMITPTEISCPAQGRIRVEVRGSLISEMDEGVVVIGLRPVGEKIMCLLKTSVSR